MYNVFVKATEVDAAGRVGKTVWLNMSRVQHMVRHKHNYTEVMLNIPKLSWNVKETPEELVMRLDEVVRNQSHAFPTARAQSAA